MAAFLAFLYQTVQVSGPRSLSASLQSLFDRRLDHIGVVHVSWKRQAWLGLCTVP